MILLRTASARSVILATVHDAGGGPIAPAESTASRSLLFSVPGFT